MFILFFSGVRPFGVSLLVCGWDKTGPKLYQCDPSGAYFAWKATPLGKNYVNSKQFLEKRWNKNIFFVSLTLFLKKKFFF